jgi:hypothetical protein
MAASSLLLHEFSQHSSWLEHQTTLSHAFVLYQSSSELHQLERTDTRSSCSCDSSGALPSSLIQI